MVAVVQITNQIELLEGIRLVSSKILHINTVKRDKC